MASHRNLHTQHIRKPAVDLDADQLLASRLRAMFLMAASVVPRVLLQGSGAAAPRVGSMRLEARRGEHRDGASAVQGTTVRRGDPLGRALLSDSPSATAISSLCCRIAASRSITPRLSDGSRPMPPNWKSGAGRICE